ncbi:16S rRNA (guanine(527)-N(7))-methyltransferase RsmG [bacterium]|nr:16S rRNA (guanine(527)-N(7))-methyltransferase RsmG [bacterium]
MIRNWTYRHNLVSRRDVDNLWKKHFIPSLKPLELGLIEESAMCIDAGSGAGFPGLPIKIFRPDIIMHLCDSNRKKALFLKQVVSELGLQNTEIFNCRLEKVDSKYDLLVSRAMGKPKETYRDFMSHVNDGGKVIIWTAKSISDDFPGCKVKSYDIEASGKLICLSRGEVFSS